MHFNVSMVEGPPVNSVKLCCNTRSIAAKLPKLSRSNSGCHSLNRYQLRCVKTNII